MTEQGRKQEEISAHKSSRTATTLTPQLGSPSPSLLAYPLQPHEYTSHHQRLYHAMMRPGTIAMAPQIPQPTPTARPCDMGPPIFMPSLNLGTPKGGSVSAASSPLVPLSAANSPIVTSVGSNLSVTGSSSSSAVTSGPTHAQSMSDMILSNAPSVAGFHSLHPFYSGPGIRPGTAQPHTYMSIPTGPPQVSAVVSNKRGLVSASPIAKPTPIQAGHAPKIGGGGSFVKTHSVTTTTTKSMGTTPPPLPTNKSAMLVTSSIPATVSSVSQTNLPSFPPGSSVIKQPSSQHQMKQSQQQQQSQTVSYHHISGVGGGVGGGGSGSSSNQVSHQQPQTYTPPPPSGKPHGNTDGAPSMGPMFFTHPAIQGHIIPVAYQTMLPVHGTPTASGNIQQPPPGGHLHPTSSTLTELLAPSSIVASPSSMREGGSGIINVSAGQGKLHDVGVRPYSPSQQQQQQQQSTINRHGPTCTVMRERSASVDTVSSGMPSPQTDNPSTTAQATADHTDTRMERPAQPSSSTSSVTQQQLPSPQGVPSPYQGPQRERSNSSEVSSIIITVPGLTGRHIAAISSNQPPGYPPTTNNNNTTIQSPPPPLPSHATTQHHIQHSPDPYRSSRIIKPDYLGGDSSIPLPSPSHPAASHPTTLHIVAGATSQNLNNTTNLISGKTSHGPHNFGLTATVISSSSSSAINSPGSPLPQHPNSLPLGISGSLMTNLSPSRRPGIIRKRPHESWKIDSPILNKQSFGSSIQLSSPGHTPRSAADSMIIHHPLSPPISVSTQSPHTTSNHQHQQQQQQVEPSHINHTGGTMVVATGRSDSVAVGDIFPSPRKKRRKQDVVVTDDQYATNVPNNIRPDIAMTMDGDHAPSSITSPRQQGSAIAMVTRARGQTDDSTPSHKEDGGTSVPPILVQPPPPGPDKIEVQYLSQIRQPQWPINGLYRMHHRAAHYHFRRHADIKHIEMETVTATSIANEKTSVVRASGWKISHLDPQIEDMLQIERDILKMVRKVETSISKCSTCLVPDNNTLSKLGEIVQGNVARSNRIISHLETTRNKMAKLLDHQPTVLDLLTKYSTTKRQSPLTSHPHKART